MNVGGVYVSNTAELPYSSVVVMTIGDCDPTWTGEERVQCLVLFDNAGCSMQGAGSVDRWTIFQLNNFFERIT